MTRIFNTHINRQYFDLVLLAMRIIIGAFMLFHGLPKLSSFLAGGDIKFSDPIGIGETPSLILTVFSEVVCSICVLFGFATRLAVIPLIFTMVVASLIVHSGDGFGKKEMALHYLLIYVVLFICGSGRYSVDQMFNKKN
jgi:putative oxidoreductase